jgi:hypothetical protein
MNEEQPPELTAEELEEQQDKALEKALPPARGKSKKQAIASLRQFKKDYKGMFDIGGLADFGHFIKGKGADAIGIGLSVYAAAETKESIDAINSTMEEATNPETKVRLQEAKVKLLEGMARHAGNLTKNGEPAEKKADKGPSLPPFPANVNVAIQNNVITEERPLES